MEGLSVLDMIQQGWIATYPLIVMSVLTITVSCERLWFLRGLIPKTIRTATNTCSLLQKGDFQKSLQLPQ